MRKTQALPTFNYSADYHLRSKQALETALSRVPLYSSWRQLDPGPEHPVDERFSALPALTKGDIRKHFPHVVPPGLDIDLAVRTGEIQLVQTSGTTDDKIVNLWNQKWWDDSEHGSWKLNSHTSRVATGNHREAILVNPKNVGIISDSEDLPFERRRVSRFLYLNEKTDPLSWTDSIQDRMIDELNTYQPKVLEANPSMLARLSRYILSQGRTVHHPAIIVFTYEYPSRLHHRQIGRAFRSPTASSYGTTEVGYVFMQCEHGRMHQNSDFCRVDFEPFQDRHGGPLAGRILVTPLGNPWNFMLRFNTGDVVRLEPQACPCGRDSGMILSSILGRTVNLTVTTSGILITLEELDAKISLLDGIEEYKLVQTEPRVFELHLAPSSSKNARTEDQAVDTLKALYGQDSTVKVIFHEAIAPEASGKYLLARTLFPVNIDDYLA